MRVRRRIVVLTLLLVALALVDGFLLLRRSRYREETSRLRAGMTALERQRADAIVAADADRATLLVELLRRQAEGDNALHLAVSSDSSYVALDRGTARLRTMAAEFGRSAGWARRRTPSTWSCPGDAHGRTAARSGRPL